MLPSARIRAGPQGLPPPGGRSPASRRSCSSTRACARLPSSGDPTVNGARSLSPMSSGDALASELDALCLDAIARFKRPKQYVFIDALPKNNYGKILKTELRAMDAKRMQGNG